MVPCIARQPARSPHGVEYGTTHTRSSFAVCQTITSSPSGSTSPRDQHRQRGCKGGLNSEPGKPASWRTMSFASAYAFVTSVVPISSARFLLNAGLFCSRLISWGMVSPDSTQPAISSLTARFVVSDIPPIICPLYLRAHFAARVLTSVQSTPCARLSSMCCTAIPVTRAVVLCRCFVMSALNRFVSFVQKALSSSKPSLNSSCARVRCPTKN